MIQSSGSFTYSLVLLFSVLFFFFLESSFYSSREERFFVVVDELIQIVFFLLKYFISIPEVEDQELCDPIQSCKKQSDFLAHTRFFAQKTIEHLPAELILNPTE